MRIAMLAVGSRGDMQPYVALGLGLQAAGHEVVLGTHSDFESFVTDHGLEFYPTGGSTRAVMTSEEGRRMAASGSNPWPFLLTLRRFFTQYAEEYLDASLAVCEGANAVLYSVFALTGYHVAEKLGVPAIPAFLQPMSRSRYFPLQPSDRLRGKVYNLMTFLVAQQAFGQIFRPVMNRWSKQLGLRPLPFAGLYSLIDRERLPVLYGFSPSVVRKPPDWGPHLHVTGYWFLDRPQGWRPPADLVDFLAAGSPPVYVGFGSMTTQEPQQTAEMVVRALKKAGRRGVLLSGWGAMHHTDLPEDVFCIESIPHDWLFPQMGAIVHHGGGGTTGAGLRAGVPSFAVPFFADQYFWGDRISRLGVGPRPIPQQKLTEDNLAAAIRAATTDEGMARQAARLGARIRAEDGVRAAVEAFEKEVGTR